MTAYQLLPALDAEQYDALRADIKAHGVRVPVDVDENGQVLDGHHRSLIAAELGIDCPRRTVAGLTETEKVAHAIAVNAHRRHLTQEQKRALLAESIKAEPEASDREHARRVGTSKNTAAAVRDGLESTGQIDQLADRRGADGRTRPASQPPRPPAPQTSPPAAPTAGLTGERPAPDLATGAGSPTTAEQFVADRDTGEVLSVEDWQARETAALDAELEQRLSGTDDRFLLNLARGLASCNSLLALSPQRAAETCVPGSDDHAALTGFLTRMEAWTAAVRSAGTPALRRIK